MKAELSAFCDFLIDEKVVKDSINQEDIIEKFIKLHTDKVHNLTEIADIVCGCVYLNIDDLKLRTRKREIVEARHIAMWMMHHYTKLSLAAIGAYFTKPDGTVFDHATVLYACRTVNNLRQSNKVFREKFDDIHEKVKARHNA